MHPFIGLSLTDAEEKPLHLLDGVLSEIEQDEQQLVSRVLQMGFAACAIAAAAGRINELLGEIGLPCGLKAGQEGCKFGWAESCEAIVDAGFMLDLGVAEHGRFPTVEQLLLQKSYSISD